MTIIAIMAGFAFGYSVTDLVMNYRSHRRINEYVKEFTNECNYDD
jgi:hypothetical protein